MEAIFSFTLKFVKTCNVSVLSAMVNTVYHKCWDLEGSQHSGSKEVTSTLCAFRRKRSYPYLSWISNWGLPVCGDDYSVRGWGKNGAIPLYSSMRIPGARLVGIWGFFPALSTCATGFLARPLSAVNREQGGQQVKPKMWHQHDDERLGRDIHWACHRCLVRFFTILHENFPVSRLASKAAICYSSPSANGGALIILR